MNKKGMPRSAKLNESAKLCSHLETGYRNINCITHFPDYFNESNVVNDDNENANIQDVNMEDEILNSDLVTLTRKLAYDHTGQEQLILTRLI